MKPAREGDAAREPRGDRALSRASGDLRIGVDLGGTKTEAVVVRLGDDPDVVARRRISTERDEGYDHIVERTCALVVDVARDAGLAASALPPIGVGMPGSTTRAEPPLVKNSNTTCLNGRPLRHDLARAIIARRARDGETAARTLLAERMDLFGRSLSARRSCRSEAGNAIASARRR